MFALLMGLVGWLSPGGHAAYQALQAAGCNPPDCQPPHPPREPPAAGAAHQSGRCLPTRFIHFLKLVSIAKPSSKHSAK